MAELFLSVSGNDSWDGLSTGTAKKTWTGIAAIIAAGDVVRVLPGEYTTSANYLGLADAKFSNVKLLCEDGVFFAPGASYNVIHVTSSVQDFYCRGLQGGTSGRSFSLSGAVRATLDRCRYIRAAGYDPLVIYNATGAKVIDSQFASSNPLEDGSQHAYVYGTSTASFLRTMLGGGKSASAYALKIATSAVVEADYCTIMQALNHGIFNASSQKSTIRDSQIIGCAAGVAAAYPLYSQNADMLEAIRCQITKSPNLKNTHYQSILTSCSVGEDLRLLNRQRKTFIVPAIDDAVSISYAEEVESELAAVGLKGTWYVDVGNINPETIGRMKDIVARGVLEIGAHSWSHTDPSYTNAITVSYSGAGTASVVVADGSVQFVSSVGGESVTVAVEDGTTIGAVKDAVSAPWAVTFPSGQNASLQSWTALASGMAYGTYSLPVTIAWDRGATGRHVLNETVHAGNFLTSLLSDTIDPNTGDAYQCVSWAAPHNTYSAEYRDAIKASGFYTNARFSSSKALVAHDVYRTNVYMLESTDSAMLSLVAGMSVVGTLGAFYAHNAGEISASQYVGHIKTLVDRLGVVATTMRDSIAEANDDGVYNSTTGIIATEYTEESIEDTRNTGSRYYGPYQGGLTAGPWTTFDSMPPLSLASAAPGSLLEVQEWTRSDVTKKQIDKVSK